MTALAEGKLVEFEAHTYEVTFEIPWWAVVIALAICIVALGLAILHWRRRKSH